MKFSDFSTSQESLKHAMKAALDKAEALAVIANFADFTAVDNKILEDYHWILSELIQEANSLYRLLFN